MFSVIIPTINEELFIGGCIDRVRAINPGVEIIIADGGSTDRTLQIAKEKRVILCKSQLGRGQQNNNGASIATGEILVFLHADTTLPDGAFEKLGNICSDEEINIGTFYVTFDVEHWFFYILKLFARLDPGFFRFGDQCFVIRKSFFEVLGGFSHQSLFEDFDLIRRARKISKIQRFPMSVKTSSRRFLLNGVLRQQMVNTFYTIQYLLGVSPERLAQKYEYNNRKINNTSLIVFIRFPHLGVVKTRLARSLGNETSTNLYRIMVENIIEDIKKLPKNINKHIFFSRIEDEIATKQWIGSGFSFTPQSGNTLGERLENAFDEVFKTGSCKTIITASDTPSLDSVILKKAISQLDYHDIVIGPNYDGGYYLLGMKKLHRQLFQGIAWSTREVLDQTMDIANRSGLSVYRLQCLHDIDDESDLKSWSTKAGNHSHPVMRYIRKNDIQVFQDISSK